MHAFFTVQWKINRVAHIPIVLHTDILCLKLILGTLVVWRESISLSEFRTLDIGKAFVELVLIPGALFPFIVPLEAGGGSRFRVILSIVGHQTSILLNCQVLAGIIWV